MAAKGLYINSTEQGFTVRGVNNNFFPDNATLAYPANSVILITDESDMATFRSASNYDVLFSALIKDININGERATKDNIIETFNEAANKPSGGGGGGNPDAFTSVEYDGTKSLIFYNDKGDEVANVDVTPFIKDGMIEDVVISDGNLVIHFNTDSDIKDIYIPLTEIFDPEAYYTKTESDAKYATQTVVNEEIASRIEAIRDVNTALQSKADKSDTYTKSQIDALIPDTSDFVSKSEYNPKEVAIAEALTQLNDTKADKTELPDVSTLATKTELNAKANTADLATVATSGSYNDLSDKPTIPDTTNLATKSEVEALEPYTIDLDAYVANGITEAQYDEIVQAVSDGRVIKATYGTRDYTVESVYVDGDVMKISLSDELKHRFFQFGRSTGTVSPTTAEYVSLVEKGVWNAKQDALVSGTNIKTINNQSILGEGNIEIQGGGGAYYISFATIATTGITDADWDGIVAAIDAHRPIYAGYPRTDGGILYYGVECMNKNATNTQIILTSSDDSSHYFYTFTKNGSNDYSYTVETRPYTTAAEKTAWNAKADASSVYTKSEIDAMVGNINTILASI